MKNKKFILLKRTFPISKYERICDGYLFLMNELTENERKNLGIIDNKIQKIIKLNEKYIYQVAKDGNEFKTMCLSFSNYKLIRIFLYGSEDD